MKSHLTLKVQPEEICTDIYVGVDLFKKELFLTHCRKMAKRFAILTDSHVCKLYGKALLDLFISEGFDATLHSFKAGEQSKTRHMKEQLEDELFRAHHGSDSCIIGLGGGVVADLAGYIAATFCRGIPYLLLPTTLLAMVDASIGGKTGVNTPFGKNLVGAIHCAEAVFMDLSILHTLSDEAMRQGTAEIIKYGLIADHSLFRLVQDNLDKWSQRNLSFTQKMIVMSCGIKMKIIEGDLKDKGKRRTLNFGHTIGHAIEALEEYQISHGEAVAIGILAECLISHKFEAFGEQELDAVYHLFKQLGFSLSLSKKVTVETMLEAMKYDKKAKKRIPRFTILKGIGKIQACKGAYCREIDEEVLREVLGWMLAEFKK